MARIALLIIVLLSVAGLVSTPTATAGTSTSIKAGLHGVGCGKYSDLGECGAGGGGSCLCEFAYWAFTGTAEVTPALGVQSFHAEYSEGHYCPEIGDNLTCLAPTVYVRSLTLRLRSGNRDTLVLVEDLSSTTAPQQLLRGNNPVSGTWTVDSQQSTGHFARYSGSGTYTLTYFDHYDWAAVGIDLRGSLDRS